MTDVILCVTGGKITGALLQVAGAVVEQGSDEVVEWVVAMLDRCSCHVQLFEYVVQRPVRMIASVLCRAVQQQVRLATRQQGAQPVTFQRRKFAEANQPQVLIADLFQAIQQALPVCRGRVGELLVSQLLAPGMPQGVQDPGFLLQCRRRFMHRVAVCKAGFELFELCGDVEIVTGQFVEQG